MHSFLGRRKILRLYFSRKRMTPLCKYTFYAAYKLIYGFCAADVTRKRYYY